MFGKNFVKILLILAVSGQVVFAKPTPDTPAKPTTPKKALCNYYPGMEFPSHDKALSPSAKLFMSFISGLMSAIVNYSEKAKPIADAILKDSELLAHIDSDEVKIFKEKLETFVNDYNDCKDVIELLKFFEIFSYSTSEFYEQEKDQKLSPEGKIILKLLKQHKVEQIEEELAAEIKNFNEKGKENDPVDVFEAFINFFHLMDANNNPKTLRKVVYAKPASDVADNVAAPEKLLCNYHGVIVPSPDEKVPSSFRLLMVTLSDLMSSSINYSKKVKPIADAILKDSELLAHIDNDEVKAFKKKLETFVKAYRDCNNGTKLFKLVKLLLGCTSEFYKQEENQKLSPEGKIILKLLKKHKLEEIEDELLENIENLVKKFEEKYPEVEDDLKNEEVYATGPKLVKWHEQLITLKYYDELVEAVYNFFERFV